MSKETAYFPFLEDSLVEQVTVTGLTSSKTFSKRLNSTLDEYGFAIVENVIPQEEIPLFEKAFALDLLSMFSVNKTNPEKFKETFGITLPPPLPCKEEEKDNKTSSHQKDHSSTLYFKKLLDEDPALVQKVIDNFPIENIPLGRLFFSDWGIAQGRLAWKTRLHQNVQRVFSAIYDDCPTTDLCTGTDVVFFENRDLHMSKSEKVETRVWPHTDKNAFLHPGGDFKIYQSLVYLWSTADKETRENMSTTVVWPKSHKQQYQELMSSASELWKKIPSHYCGWPEARHQEFIDNARRVPVPKGGMLVFASHLFHQGWNPVIVDEGKTKEEEEEEEGQSQNNIKPEKKGGRRLTIPISMEPKSLRSSEALSDKIYALVSGNPTTHWASLGQVAARSRRDGFEFETSTKHFTVRNQIHHHFKDDDKETSEFWQSEKNRQVGLVEKGKAWVQSTLLPIKLGGMISVVPFHEYPQCVLDML